MQAAEQGLYRMAELLTELAASGALPPEFSGQLGAMQEYLAAMSAGFGPGGPPGWPGGPGGHDGPGGTEAGKRRGGGKGETTELEGGGKKGVSIDFYSFSALEKLSFENMVETASTRNSFVNFCFIPVVCCSSASNPLYQQAKSKLDTTKSTASRIAPPEEVVELKPKAVTHMELQ